MRPKFEYDGQIEQHYHVPCGFWLSSQKCGAKLQTEFSKKWIEKTKEIIESKPEHNKFCKVVASIEEPYFWNSQITIFYDEKYYHDFFIRTGPYQTWTEIEGVSFAKKTKYQYDIDGTWILRGN